MIKKKLFHYTLAVTCFLMACHVSQRTLESNPVMQQEIDKQGHRGCRGLLPENTIPAMRRALDLGVTTLEMDVVITRDRKVVLSHDQWMNHEISIRPDGREITAGEEKTYNIFGMDYSEVRKFDVGLKPHPRFPKQEKIPAYKPLLSEVFDSIRVEMMTRKRPFPYYNIETKCLPAGDNIFHPEPAEFVELLMEVINSHGVADHVIIQSFDFRTLQYLHQRYPSIRTAMLIEGDDKRSLDQQLADLGFTPTIYSPEHHRVDAALVGRCHELGMRVIPWTVNDLPRISALKKLGVDGIISDYPNLFN